MSALDTIDIEKILEDPENVATTIIDGLVDGEKRRCINANVIRLMIKSKFDDYCKEIKNSTTTDSNDELLKQLMTEITEDIIIVLSTAGLADNVYLESSDVTEAEPLPT